MKGVEKKHPKEMNRVLYDFHYMHALNEIMPLKAMLNEKYIINDKKAKTWEKKEIKRDETVTQDPKDLLDAYDAIRSGASNAVQEIFATLSYYQQNDNVEYNNLTKTMQKTCVKQVVAFFKNIEKKAEECWYAHLMQ